jgi:hypothetical protein
MNQKALFSLVLAILAGDTFGAKDQAPISLGYAQQLSGKSIEDVKAADVNGDKHIDAAEFSALNVRSKAVPATSSD